MSLDFGKLDFAVSFNRQTAFPLDARSYFESIASAEAAARSAQPAGSKNSVYYYGQTVCVVENNVANMYIIQPNNTLKEIGGITINTNQFVLDETGTLNLLGFSEAVAGAQLTKTADGKLSWVKPDNSTIDELITNVEELKQILGASGDEENGIAATGIYAELNKKANAVDVYTKTETDNAIAFAVAGVAHLKREIFDCFEDAYDAMVAYGENADEYIYMVKKASPVSGDNYDEYMAFKGDDWYLEKVGNWEVDLNDYAKKTDVEIKLAEKVNIVDLEELLNAKASVSYVDTQLNNKVDKKDNYDLMSILEREKLANIEDGAQVNYIKQVNPVEFTVDEFGNLSLLGVAQNKVVGLEDALNRKVDAIDGHRLITPKEIEKLNSLSIGEDGSVGISGTVNASKVQDLYSTVVNITTGKGTGLFDGELKELLGIEVGAQVNTIDSVDEHFEIVEKQLTLKNLPISKVIDLESTLNSHLTSINNLEDRVDALEGMLTWTEMVG